MNLICAKNIYSICFIFLFLLLPLPCSHHGIYQSHHPKWPQQAVYFGLLPFSSENIIDSKCMSTFFFKDYSKVKVMRKVWFQRLVKCLGSVIVNLHCCKASGLVQQVNKGKWILTSLSTQICFFNMNMEKTPEIINLKGLFEITKFTYSMLVFTLNFRVPWGAAP